MCGTAVALAELKPGIETEVVLRKEHGVHAINIDSPTLAPRQYGLVDDRLLGAFVKSLQYGDNKNL